MKTPQRLWAALESGEFVLRDAAGRTLAHGRDVTSASLATATCRIDQLPVRVRRYADWWLWWV